MANYKMILQYDGTRYRGWQVLPAELTVQGKLQDVLSKMQKLFRHLHKYEQARLSH